MFKVKESNVRRRYSDFEWLRSELERDSKVSGSTINYKEAGVFAFVKKRLIFYFRLLCVFRLLFLHCLVKLGNDKCRSEEMMEFSRKTLSRSVEKV